MMCGIENHQLALYMAAFFGGSMLGYIFCFVVCLFEK